MRDKKAPSMVILSYAQLQREKTSKREVISTLCDEVNQEDPYSLRTQSSFKKPCTLDSKNKDVETRRNVPEIQKPCELS